MRFHNSCLYLFIYILFPLSRILVESQDTPPVAKVGEKTAVALAPISSKFPELNEGIITDLRTLFTQKQQGRHHLILDIEWDFSTLSFTYSRVGDVVTFTAKDNYVFRLVKQNSRVLWEALSPSEDSKKVVYNLNDKVTIYRLDGSSLEIKLTLVSINVSKKRSTDIVKYESDAWDETHTFTVQDPYLIYLVTKGDHVQWRASNGDYAKKIITKKDKDGNTVLEVLYPNKEDGEVLVEGVKLKDSSDFSEEYTFYFSEHLKCASVKYNNKSVWRCEKLGPNQFVKVKKKNKGISLNHRINIEVYTLGSQGPNDPNMYNFRRIDESEGHFIFHKRVKCNAVKMNGRTVWSHNRQDYGAIYPKAVSYFGPDEIHITFSDFLLFLDKEDGLWDPFFYDYHEEDAGDDGFDPNQAIDPNHQVDNEPQDPNQQQDPSEQAPANESTDSNQQPSTENDNNNNNNDVKFDNSIARLNKNQNNSNPTSSDQDSSTTPDPNSSNPVSTNGTIAASDTRPARALQPIQLDMRKKESTEAFDYLKADGWARYTAKPGYGFSSVKRSGSCCGSGGSGDFWDTKDSKNYASNVYRDGATLCGSMNNVTIFFPNKTYKHFTKIDKKWFQLMNFELFSNGSNNQELDESQYSLNESEENLFYSLNEGSKCTEVKYIVRKPDPSKSTNLVMSHITIWKHDNSKYSNKYPILFSYYCPEQFIVNFDDMLTILKRKEVEKWEETHLFDFQMFGNDSFMGTNLKILDFKKYEVSEVGDEYHIKFASDAHCSQLKHKASELWKHDSTKHGDRYPVLLRYKKDGSHLFMDFGPFFVLSHKVEDKLKAHDVFIKLYTKASDGKLVEIDYTEYTFIEESDELHFLLDKKVVCDEIKYKGEKVWGFDEKKHKKEHPYMVTYKKDESAFTVNFERVFTVYEKETNNNWNPLDFDIRLYARDPKNLSNNNKLYGNNYTLSEDGDDYVFKFKESIKCSVINMVSGNLWTHSDVRFGDKFPTLVRYNRIKTKLIINFDHMYIVFLKGEDDKWEDPKLYNIKLYGYDSSDPNASASNSIELFDNKYIFEDDMLEHKFKFNQDVKCTKVKMDSQELWNHDPNVHEGKHPILVRYTKDGLKFLIIFDGFYLSYTKDSDGLWIQKESITLDIPIKTLTVSATQLPPDPAKPTDTQPESDSDSTAAESDSGAANPESTDTQEADANSQSQPESETTTTDPDSQQEDSTDPSSPSTESQPADEESQSQQPKPAVKTITVLEDSVPHSDYYTFASHKYYNTFIANDQYLFKSITLGNKVVYQPIDVYESAFKVLAYKDYNGEVRCIDVFLLSGSIKRFSKMDYLDEWYQRLTPLALDIKMKGSGYYFDLSSSGNIQSFLSKDNFGFRKVRYGMKKVWQSADHKGNSHKVDVKEFEDHTHLKIHLFNGDTREFSVKKADFAQFEIPKPEVQTIIPGTKPSIPKLPGGKSPSEMEIKSPMNMFLYKVEEPEEASSTPPPRPPPPKITLVEIDIEKKETTDEVEYIRRDDKKADIFKAKPLHLISRAMKGTEEMWKAEDDKNAIIIAVTVDKNNQTKCNPIFPKTDPSKPVDPPKTPGLFDLDVSVRRNTEDYTYSHDRQKKLDSFICRPGFKVRYVKKGNDILWEPRDNRNPVHVDIYYIPVIEKPEEKSEKAPEAAKSKPKHKLGVVVYYQNKCRHLSLKDDPGTYEEDNAPVPSSPKPQEVQDTAKTQQAKPAPKPQLAGQQAKEPDKQPEKQPETKTGSAGSDADSSGKASQSPDPSSTESKTAPKEGPDGTTSPLTSHDQTGTKSFPSSQPADQDSQTKSDQIKSGDSTGEDGSSTPADGSGKTGEDEEDEDEDPEEPEESESEESSDDSSSGKVVLVLDAKSSEPEPSTPPPTSSITPSSRSHSSPTAISSFPTFHSSSSRYTSSSKSSSTTKTYSLDVSFTASNLVSGTTDTTPETSSSLSSTIVSPTSTTTTILSESSSPSTTVVTDSSTSDVNLESGQSGSTSTPVSGSTSDVTKPSTQTTPSTQTARVSTQRVMTAAQNAAASAPVTFADDADEEPEKEPEPPKVPEQDKGASSAQQAKTAPQTRPSGAPSRPPSRPASSSCSGRPPARIGAAAHNRTGSQQAGQTRIGGTTTVNLRTGERTSGTSGGTQSLSQRRLSSGHASRTSTAARTSGSANQQAGRAATTPPARTSNQTSGGQGTRTGSGTTPAARTSIQPSGGSSVNPPKPAGQQGGGSVSGRAAITAGQGGGQSTPKPQTGSSGAHQSNSTQQAKPTTPPAGGSAGSGTSGSDDNDIDSVIIGVQETTTTITHTTRTFTSSTLSSSSSGGTGTPGLLVQISD